MSCDNCDKLIIDGKLNLDIAEYCRECEENKGIRLGKEGWCRMGKYGPGMTVSEVSELETHEAEEILAKYVVSETDLAVIKNMIRSPYYELGLAFRSGRLVEAYIMDKYGEDAFKDYFDMLYGKKEPSERLGKELARDKA